MFLSHRGLVLWPSFKNSLKAAHRWTALINQGTNQPPKAIFSTFCRIFTQIRSLDFIEYYARTSLSPRIFDSMMANIQNAIFRHSMLRDEARGASLITKWRHIIGRGRSMVPTLPETKSLFETFSIGLRTAQTVVKEFKMHG